MFNVSFVYLKGIVMLSSRSALGLKQQNPSSETKILCFECSFFFIIIHVLYFSNYFAKIFLLGTNRWSVSYR